MNRFLSQRSAHRHWRLAGIATVTALATTAALAGCSGTAPSPGTPIDTGSIPSYYPANYSDIITASRKEGGELVMYTNTDQANLAPILRDFQKKYPWITKVSANNLDSDTVFQRQVSEMATGSAPADILLSNAVQAWSSYIAKGNTVMKYDSPELTKLPPFAQLMPSVYSVSMDAVGLAFNTSLLPSEPASIADLNKIVSSNPAKYKGKVTTRDVAGAFGFTVSQAFTTGNAKAWSSLEKTLPLARPETTSGTQLEKILSGEYVAGFFISSAVAYPAQEKSGGLLKFTFPKDGTVVIGRGLGITPKAPHPATAKLFLDFVLSAKGQNAVAEGGLSAYREGVELAKGRHTYQEIQKAVGKDGIILVPYTVVPDAEVSAFVNRWNGMLGK